MALTPERLDLSDGNALHRRSRVGRFFAVDMPLLQKFVPASRRGWISGASMSLLPAGPLAAGLFSAWLGPIVGRRGLLALKLRQVGFINQLCR